ncbi:MAG: hypothetical protein KDC35_08975 [Acidobacteria bacterium]|nr:hypothetical protein [Acidobacteriota bacterium]
MRDRKPRASRARLRGKVRATIDGKYHGWVRDVSFEGCQIVITNWMQVDRLSHVVRLDLPKVNAIVLHGSLQRVKLSKDPDGTTNYEIGFRFDTDSPEFERYSEWLQHVASGTKSGQVKIFQSDDQIVVSRLADQINRLI